jgi:hypothetical protein
VPPSGSGISTKIVSLGIAPAAILPRFSWSFRLYRVLPRRDRQ